MYSLLVTIDFPETLTAGLRRTINMVRGVLERSRGDLTLALRQKELETKLEKFTVDYRNPCNSPSPGKGEISS